ncbi:MAG: hypothetical protein ACI9TK_000564 [Flavobacteriaceae bacterium]|jgi:hypothetical protein|tara:strand:+ start:14295 stop:14771 length:477 start_codon:yes stop_codon:yes gene_type:complete
MNVKKVYHLELEEDFEKDYIIALHTPLEAYQLAFYLNRTINSNFKRSRKDLRNKASKGDFIHFEWEDKTHDFQCSLFSNKCQVEIQQIKSVSNTLFDLSLRNEVSLLPELKQVDFFIKSSDYKTIETVLPHLKKWSFVSLLYKVDSEVIKNQLNIIFN